jgi:hypothetical protein
MEHFPENVISTRTVGITYSSDAGREHFGEWSIGKSRRPDFCGSQIVPIPLELIRSSVPEFWKTTKKISLRIPQFFPRTFYFGRDDCRMPVQREHFQAAFLELHSE